ncbi:MAG: PIN domain-containing protein [Bacteroidota bacterium]
MAKDTIVMCDTNIIVELFKNNKVIKEQCSAIGENNLCISAVTAAEFYYGTLNKREFNKIKKHISNFPIIHINDEISKIFLNTKDFQYINRLSLF